MSPFGLQPKTGYIKKKSLSTVPFALVPTGRNTYNNIKMSPKPGMKYWKVLPTNVGFRCTKSQMKAMDSRMMTLPYPVLIPKHGAYGAATFPKAVKRKAIMMVPKKFNRGLSSGSAANSDTDYSDSASDISGGEVHHDLVRHFAIADLPPKARKLSSKLPKVAGIQKPKKLLRVLNDEEKTARRFGVPLALPVKQEEKPEEKAAEVTPPIKESAEAPAKDTTTTTTTKDCSLPCPGHLQYECTRCFILYSSLDQIEQHIGQFHIRQEDGCPVFQLSEDNFDSLVCVKWDAVAAGGSGSVAATSTALAQQLMPPPAVWYRPSVTFTASATLSTTDASYYRNVTTAATVRSSSAEPVSDDSFVSTADWSMDAEIAMALDQSINYKVFQLPAEVTPKRAYKKKKVILKMKEKKQVMVKKPTKKYTKKRDREMEGMEVDGEWYSANTVRKVRLGLQERNGEKLRGGKNMRKCRSVYGIQSQELWCNMCKWKKRCSRFGSPKNKDDEE